MPSRALWGRALAPLEGQRRAFAYCTKTVLILTNSLMP